MKKICKICGVDFKPYQDGRGGDIGGTVCKECSCHHVQDIDRGSASVRKKYETEICPFYNSR